MKVRFQNWFNRLFPQPVLLPVGIYHYQSPPEQEKQYRLHLRIEKDGSGLLIINASTVLHLNQTAAEYAYYMINGESEETISKKISTRYQIKRENAASDYHTFEENLSTLISTPDLAPETFFGYNRVDPYSQSVSAPYRLDCAITYKTEESVPNTVTPQDRVTRELITSEWETILSKAWQAGIPHVIFTGGEPTLRPDLPELVQIAERLGMVSGVLTDGLRLSDTHYLHQLLQSGLDHVMIVFDPGDSQSVEAIRDVIAEDIHLTVHFTLSSAWDKKAFEIIDQLHKLGVTTLSLSVPKASLKQRMQEVRDYAVSLGLQLVWDLPVPYSIANPVSLELSDSGVEPSKAAGKAWLYVEPDGDVRPEQGDPALLGNLLTDTWEDVWSKVS
ncbi:MAG TPA: radical SAM/SPASM domain-containing protein [Longilinea sp.]|nr:radical SAM/SPASM domain-containing protein [Longilinea sp.]